jgi:uncharacterized membrane protein YgcG
MFNSLKEILALILFVIVVGIIFAIGIFTIAVMMQSIWKANRDRQKSIHNREKSLAILEYARELGKLLRERDGIQAKYHPDRIMTAIKIGGLNSDRACYGIAMYAEYDDFMAYHESIGESCNYYLMRDEIKECLSLSDNTFSSSEAIDAGDRIDNFTDLDRDRSVEYSHDRRHPNDDISHHSGHDLDYGSGDYGGSDAGGGDAGGGGGDY